jgi:hypothetical protein
MEERKQQEDAGSKKNAREGQTQCMDMMGRDLFDRDHVGSIKKIGGHQGGRRHPFG